jgi:outer membrane protein assembly factor BamB
MVSKCRIAVLSALCACCLVSSRAEDWGQWRGPNRSGRVPSDWPVPETFSGDLKVNWRVKIGEGLASPVVSGGKVVYLDHQEGKEVVHAVNMETGSPLWDAPLDDAFKDSQGPIGPRCTPVIHEDLVYAQSCKGELQCFSLRSGRKLWGVNYQKKFGSVFIGEKGQAQGASRHGYNGAPVVDGERLFAVVGGTNEAGIVCFNKETGKVLWKSQKETAAYAPPIIANFDEVKQVVAFTADSLLSVSADKGKLLWRVPLKTTLARHVTTPTILGDSVYVGSHELGLVRVKVTAKDGKFQAKQEWALKEAAFNFASPVALGDQLYGLGPKKNLVCVDPKGEVLWSKEGYFTTDAGKAWASFLVMQDNLLMLTDSGQLVLLGAGPRECHEISRTQVCGANWCYPAYADGRLYLRDNRELICVTLVR